MSEDTTSVITDLLVTGLFLDVPRDQIGPDDGLQSVLGLDSVGFLELRVLCERRFNIRIPDDQFNSENFRSVRRLAGLVNNLTNGVGSAS